MSVWATEIFLLLLNIEILKSYEKAKVFYTYLNDRSSAYDFNQGLDLPPGLKTFLPR